MIGILIRFSSGMWHPFVVTWNLRSFVCVTTFYQSSETVSSTFLKLFELFSLSLIFFYWFGRSVLFLACLCFVPPYRWRQAHYTHVLLQCQALFWKFMKKVFQESSCQLIVKRKGQKLFFPALFNLYEIIMRTCGDWCQGQSTHHF